MRRVDRQAREVVRIFRVILKLEEELQACHGENKWDLAWEIAVRLRRAIKASRHQVDRFADMIGELK
jgi:hypothetical protein